MRRAIGAGLIAGLAGAVLLPGCDGKQTGPDPAASPTAPATASPVPAAISDPGAVRPIVSFAGADTDGDGRVTSAEYAAAAAKLFAAMDANNNGSVTVEEMDAARAALGGFNAASSEKAITEADNDGDDKLTLAEFVAAANARFTRADADKDGALSEAEWTVAHPPGLPASAPGTPEAGEPAATGPAPPAARP